YNHVTFQHRSIVSMRLPFLLVVSSHARKSLYSFRICQRTRLIQGKVRPYAYAVTISLIIEKSRRQMKRGINRRRDYNITRTLKRYLQSKERYFEFPEH